MMDFVEKHQKEIRRKIEQIEDKDKNILKKSLDDSNVLGDDFDIKINQNMKRILLLLLLALFFACKSSTNKYEKLIADIVQTDSRGTKYDLNFKAERLEIIQEVSVGDSIRIITDNFECFPRELTKYEGRDTSEILAVVVRCTYSIDEPVTNKRATEVFDFLLSPDGTRYYSQKRVID